MSDPLASPDAEWPSLRIPSRDPRMIRFRNSSYGEEAVMERRAILPIQSPAQDPRFGFQSSPSRLSSRRRASTAGAGRDDERRLAHWHMACAGEERFER